MLPHGPDAEAFMRASNAELKPHKLENTMAFMFESRHAQRVTRFAAEAPQLQQDYRDCWAELPKLFNPAQP
jgi:homogentisate 1,2-dioxygenase